MKIKEIRIKDYGPINDFSLAPGNFEIVFGLNESGKTTIVEALTYILFKRNLQTLRYGRPEDINIAIESANKIYRLPAKKLNIELPGGDISSLLYVQASESSLYEKLTGGARFWDNIKLMLSQGSQYISFAKLGEKVFEAVGLMPKKTEWKRDKQNIIDNEKYRSEELSRYINDIGEIEKKRLELIHLSEEYEKLKKELKALENYKNYKNYREVSNLYGSYFDKKNGLLEYERYKDEYFEEWQKLEADLKSRLQLEENFKDTDSEIKILGKKRVELNKVLEILEREGFEDKIATMQETKKEPSTIYAIAAFFAGFLSLLLTFRFGLTLIIPIAIFALSVILFITYVHKKTAVLRSTYQKSELLERAKVLLPDVSNLDEILERISHLKNEYTKYETSMNEKQAVLIKLSAGKTIPQIEVMINALRNKTGLAEFSQFQHKINEKRKIKQELGELSSRIFGFLSEKDETKWSRLIQERKTEPLDKEYDLSREKDLRAKFVTIEEKIKHLRGDIEIFEKVKRTQFNLTDDHEAYIGFAQLQKRLHEYELEKEAALNAAQIFNQLSSEMDDFIEGITQGEASLSNYFQLVTDRYKKVVVRNKEFLVIDDKDRELPSDKLSSGAKDQLLLCFRFAALKKLYPQGTFLILDDAFLFADWQRRRKLAELLKKFVEDGNQVIYLTSDDHTRDLFKELGAQTTTI